MKLIPIMINLIFLVSFVYFRKQFISGAGLSRIVRLITWIVILFVLLILLFRLITGTAVELPNTGPIGL